MESTNLNKYSPNPSKYKRIKSIHLGSMKSSHKKPINIQPRKGIIGFPFLQPPCPLTQVGKGKHEWGLVKRTNWERFGKEKINERAKEKKILTMGVSLMLR